MSTKYNYIPAMGFFSLSRWYDPLVSLLMNEARFKGQLIENARIPPAGAVLDVGCGTGTLLLMVKIAQPEARVRGLDGDDGILKIARGKIMKSSWEVPLEQAMAYDMPYADKCFDRVLTSLTLHHLSGENTRRTLQEVLRVLVPGGELHVADFSGGHQQLGHLKSHFRLHSGRPGHMDASQLELLLVEAGFSSVETLGATSTLLGRIGYFSGAKPRE
jgi:ubiquinone/menaquinone biosynthesis C-methylase UbiE